LSAEEIAKVCPYAAVCYASILVANSVVRRRKMYSMRQHAKTKTNAYTPIQDDQSFALI
jgi:hypothetical protein